MIFIRCFHEVGLSEADFGLELLLDLLADINHLDVFLEINTLCLLYSDIETHLGHFVHLVGLLLAVEVFFIEHGLLMLETTRAIEEHLVDMMSLLLAFLSFCEHCSIMFNNGTTLDRALEGRCHLKRIGLHLRWADIDIAA